MRLIYDKSVILPVITSKMYTYKLKNYFVQFSKKDMMFKYMYVMSVNTENYFCFSQQRCTHTYIHSAVNKMQDLHAQLTF